VDMGPGTSSQPVMQPPVPPPPPAAPIAPVPPQAFAAPPAPQYPQAYPAGYPVAANPYAAPFRATPPVGVGGWLLFLILCLTIFGPLLALFFVVFLLIGAGIISKTNPDIIRFAIVYAILVIASSAWGLVSGISLWKVQPGAVRRTKFYFVCGAIPAAFLINIIPFLLLAPSERVTNEARSSVIWIVIYTAWFLSWHAYLRKSRRVDATYPQG